METEGTSNPLSELEARLATAQANLYSLRSQIRADQERLQEAIHELDEQDAETACEFLNSNTTIFDEFEVTQEFGVTVEVQLLVRARSEADAREIVEMNFDADSRQHWDVESVEVTVGNY